MLALNRISHQAFNWHIDTKSQCSSFQDHLHLLVFGCSDTVSIYLDLDANKQSTLMQIDRSWNIGTVVRILSPSKVSDQTLQKLHSLFQPVLITHHFQPESADFCYQEYFFNTSHISQSSIRELCPQRYAAYKKSIRNHPQVKYCNVSQSELEQYKTQILEFLSEWHRQTGLQPEFDRRLFHLFFEQAVSFSQTHFGVLLDQLTEQIIGISCFSKTTDQYVTSHVNKVLRGYSQIGTRLLFETLLHAMATYPIVKHILVGGPGSKKSQKSFKDSFVNLGGIVTHNIRLLSVSPSIANLSHQQLALVSQSVWTGDRPQLTMTPKSEVSKKTPYHS